MTFQLVKQNTENTEHYYLSTKSRAFTHSIVMFKECSSGTWFIPKPYNRVPRAVQLTDHHILLLCRDPFLTLPVTQAIQCCHP